MDKIADFCTCIRNGLSADHSKVDIPLSKMKAGIAEQMKNYGYIRGYRVAQSGAQGLIRVYLKYKKQGEPAIQHIGRVSKPSPAANM